MKNFKMRNVVSTLMEWTLVIGLFLGSMMILFFLIGAGLWGLANR